MGDVIDINSKEKVAGDLKPVEYRPVVAVDFDNTLVDFPPNWNFEKEPFRIGAPRPMAAAALALFKAHGWNVIIHTTRPDEWFIKGICEKLFPNLVDAVNCNPWQAQRYGISTPKPYANMYIDDAAFPLVLSGQPIQWNYVIVTLMSYKIFKQDMVMAILGDKFKELALAYQSAPASL